MPFFSVIIPLYNKAAWVAATIDSVCKQEFSDFEIIVVNNGSTDDSAQIVQAIADPRIRLIEIANEGVSVARNKGIEVSSSPYLAFLDADDWWLPDFLSRIYALIQQYPDAIAYGCGYAFAYPDKIVKPRLPHLPAQAGRIDNYFTQVAGNDMLLTASSCCIPKTSFEKWGVFPPNERIGEDQDMWARLALAGPLAFDPELAAYYRQGVSGMATAAAVDTRLWPFVERLLAIYNTEKGRKIPDLGRYAAHQLVGQASQLVLAGELKIAASLLAKPEARLTGLRYFYWTFRLQWRKLITLLHG